MKDRHIYNFGIWFIPHQKENAPEERVCQRTRFPTRKKHIPQCWRAKAPRIVRWNSRIQPSLIRPESLSRHYSSNNRDCLPKNTRRACLSSNWKSSRELELGKGPQKVHEIETETLRYHGVRMWVYISLESHAEIHRIYSVNGRNDPQRRPFRLSIADRIFWERRKKCQRKFCRARSSVRVPFDWRIIANFIVTLDLEAGQVKLSYPANTIGIDSLVSERLRSRGPLESCQWVFDVAARRLTAELQITGYYEAPLCRMHQLVRKGCRFGTLERGARLEYWPMRVFVSRRRCFFFLFPPVFSPTRGKTVSIESQGARGRAEHRRDGNSTIHLVERSLRRLLEPSSLQSELLDAWFSGSI